MAKPQTTNYKPQTVDVGIIMGSDSDLAIMQAAADILKEFGIPFELTVVSAHGHLCVWLNTQKQPGSVA